MQVLVNALRTWSLPVTLFVLTLVSTLYVGASWSTQVIAQPSDLIHGASFAFPLLAILLAHEMGHYIAGRLHNVDISPPYFIPMPFFLFGTMGAVIRLRQTINSRRALFDVGISGPLAGLVVAIPVFFVGLLQSPLLPLAHLPQQGVILQEGRSLLYGFLLYLAKGTIPPGYDVFLTPMALAGWVGFLVTMINLVPSGQLDGGHIAYALWGTRQNIISRWVRRALPLFGVALGLLEAFPLLTNRASWDSILQAFLTGVHWIVWGALLALLQRGSKIEHPPTSHNEELGQGRERLGFLAMVLFVLLFMPYWLKVSS